MKLGRICNIITSLDFRPLRQRDDRHRRLVHGIIALFCTPEPTSALAFHHDHRGYKKGKLTHLKHALLLAPRDMTRVHQMTFAHTEHFLASLEGVPCVVGATIFKVVDGLAWMVRDVKGGGRDEEEEEEDESRG